MTHCVKKILYLLSLFLVVFFVTNTVHADELLITKTGEIVLVGATQNILGATSGTIHITISITPPVDYGDKIMVGLSDTLTQQNTVNAVDKVTLEQISEEPIVISTASGSGQLTIRQGPVTVTTQLTVLINPETQTLQVVFGQKSVDIITPSKLVTILVGEKVMNATVSRITLEQENGIVNYHITGSEKLIIVKLIKLTLPIKITVSARTGKIARIQRHFISSVLWSVNRVFNRVFRWNAVVTDLR